MDVAEEHTALSGHQSPYKCQKQLSLRHTFKPTAVHTHTHAHAADR